MSESTDLDLIRRGIDALRSGKYEQDYSALRTADTCFCAVGVLCDVYDREAWENDREGYYYTFEEIADKLEARFFPN